MSCNIVQDQLWHRAGLAVTSVCLVNTMKLSKVVNHSEPQDPHLQNRDRNSTDFLGHFCELRHSVVIKHLM